MRLFVASAWGGVFAQIKSLPYLCSRNQKPSLPKARKNGRDRNDSVAQLVEQVTLNHWVVSSSLTGVTSQAGIASLEVIPAFFLSAGCSGRRRRALLPSWISPLFIVFIVPLHDKLSNQSV